MKRREFITLLGGAAAAWPLAARAQQPAMPTIGWLDQIPRGREVSLAAFNQGLAETGYVAGRNVTIEHRDAEGDSDRLPALAADLVRRHVSVIIATTGTAAQVAKAATQTIPVVFSIGGDPVESGLVASFNRPAGNLTGVAVLAAEIAAKRLELLHKLVPAAETIAILVRSPSSDFGRSQMRGFQSAAPVLGVRLLVLNAVTESEIAAAFSTLVEQQARALMIGAEAIANAARDQIISLAGRYAVPAIFVQSAFVEAGGLVSYGPDFDEIRRQVGRYTGRILKGEKPGDLPVVQPTKFEFVINLETAKRLGLTVPPTLLALADRVIE